MPRINPEHISAVIKMVNGAPYFELLSIRLCEVDVAYARVELSVEKKHINPFGAVHGGVYSSILDTAAYWSAYCQVDEGLGFTTVDVNASMLSMTDKGKIIVEGKALKVGRSICLTESVAKDGSGKLLAHSTSKLMILRGKQSIEDAIAALGHKPLPPKFID
jgi:uncharacterized protein (TIGR00369 family)